MCPPQGLHVFYFLENWIKNRHIGTPRGHKGFWCMENNFERQCVSVTNIIPKGISHLEVTCRAFHIRLWKSMIIFFKVFYGLNIFSLHKYLIWSQFYKFSWQTWLKSDFQKCIFKINTFFSLLLQKFPFNIKALMN